MSVRAIVFDLFDTLVDLRAEDLASEEYKGRRIPASARVTHALVQARHDVAFDAFEDAMLEGMQALQESHLAHDREVTTFQRMSDALARLGIDDVALAEEMSTIHMGVLKSVVRAPSHHRELLDRLGGRVALGLCSNFSHSPTAHAVLAESGFDDHLGAVVVSDAFGWRKPREEIFLETVRRLGVDPAETLHVGDSLRADVAGAARAGLRTAWITRRVRDPEKALAQHEGPKPDHHLSDLAELLGLLDRMGA